MKGELPMKIQLTKSLKKSLGLALGAMLTLGALSAPALAADYPSEQAVLAELATANGTVFPVGGPNTAYEKYFTGQTYIKGLASDGINVANVTFIKGAHTYWHKHHGSCQVLVPESGRGYYQIWGEEARELKPGMVVTIPENVKHWHGAAPGTMMQHLSIMQMGESVTTEWLEPVSDAEFAKLK